MYRVHSLPESMRPLVWDFGQLKPEIEELYTRQIVSRFVSSNHPDFPTNDTACVYLTNEFVVVARVSRLDCTDAISMSFSEEA